MLNVALSETRRQEPFPGQDETIYTGPVFNPDEMLSAFELFEKNNEGVTNLPTPPVISKEAEQTADLILRNRLFGISQETAKANGDNSIDDSLDQALDALDTLTEDDLSRPSPTTESPDKDTSFTDTYFLRALLRREIKLLLSDFYSDNFHEVKNNSFIEIASEELQDGNRVVVLTPSNDNIPEIFKVVLVSSGRTITVGDFVTFNEALTYMRRIKFDNEMDRVINKLIDRETDTAIDWEIAVIKESQRVRLQPYLLAA